MTLRQTTKRFLPAFLMTLLKRVEMYGKRISVLWDVILTIKGASAQDKRIVRRSLIRAPLLMLKNLDQWRDPYLLQDAVVVSAALGTFSIRAHSDDLIHIMASHHKELFVTIRSIVSEGDTIIDAGANIGGVTVFMARQAGPTGQVIAIEMMPATAKCLRRNLELNDFSWVQIEENALSDIADGVVQARVPVGFFGQASIAETIPAGNLNANMVEVSTTTIDDITADLGEIALMKMDLEGVEALALKGAKHTLPKIRNILFESWGKDDDATANILRDSGFNISPIDGLNFLASRTPEIQ